MTYDALETVAPLVPETDYITSKFEHDNFVKGRQVRTRYLHGDKDREVFDAENFDLLEENPRTAAYKDRLRTERLGLDKGRLTELEQEKEAAIIVPTKLEWEQFMHDVHNPDFAAKIKSNVIKSNKKVSEVERVNELTDPKAQKQRKEKLAQAFAEHTRKTKENPDFYTGFTDYNRKDDAAATSAQAKIRQRHNNNDDDDDDDDVNDKDAMRDDNTLTSAEERRKAKKERENENTPVQISNEDARQLLAYNPLARLQSLMHKDFHMLPEVSQTWELLMPLQLKPEKYRQHYNAVEFLRAMNLCGAKYDGCVLLATPGRLAQLLDKGFYSNCFEGDVLRSDHEHYDDEETVLAVFKFYLVRRSKDNVAALGKYALDDDDGTNLVNMDLFDPGRLLREQQQIARLNKPGLYDADNVAETNDDDGTSEYGSLHEIKDLQKEFMFCLRVVCVVPHDDKQHTRVDDVEEFASVEDGDFVVPEVLQPPPTAAGENNVGSGERLHLGGDDTFDEAITIGPEDQLGVESHSMAAALTSPMRSATNVVDNLQPSEFDDDNGGGLIESSSGPREIIVSDATGLTNTSSNRMQQQQSRTSGTGNKSSSASLLFGGDAGSKSDADDDVDDDDLVDRARQINYQSKARRRHNQQRQQNLISQPERFGVRFEDIAGSNLSEDHNDNDDDDNANYEYQQQRRKKSAITDESEGELFIGRAATRNNMFGSALASSAAAAATDGDVGGVSGSNIRHTKDKKTKYETHTDDENSEREQFSHASLDDDSSANDVRPEEHLIIDAVEARRLVGVWKAPDIMSKINRRYLTKLCVRAFAYYAVSLPVTTSAVGKGKKKKK